MAPASPLSSARFQLRHCGPLLPREEPPERDPRVVTFNPDLWQRKVGLHVTHRGLQCCWSGYSRRGVLLLLPPQVPARVEPAQGVPRWSLAAQGAEIISGLSAELRY